MKSLEQQLMEKDEEIRMLRQKLGKSAVATALAQELSESGLPEVAQARIRKRFETTGKADGIKAAIAEEQEYVREARKAIRKQINASGAASSGAAPRVDLVDCYKAMGLSEKEARLAAGVESAVENITEARRELRNAAKSLGLNDAEADAFSRGPSAESW